MKLLHRTGREIPLKQLSDFNKLAIYPGSFNPLHKGHKGIYRLLTQQGFRTVFEISKTRYQKPAYSDAHLARLVSQFSGYADLLISDAPLFSQKRDQLSLFNPHWVMGYDTAKRWIAENERVDKQESAKIAAMNIVLVGRLSEGVYWDPTDLLTGHETYQYRILHFQCDVSSTQIRENTR